MRISELSTTAGISTATIKYYLREGMLPAGQSVGPRDAVYGPPHVERLGLIRNLREIADLPVATIKRLLNAADDPDVPIPQLLAQAHAAVLPTCEATDDERQLAQQLYAGLDWNVPARSPVFAMTARLLGILHRSGAATDAPSLQPWAEAADQVARTEMGLVRADGSRALLVHDVVIGTSLGNQLLIALRMAAQVNRATSQRIP